MIVGVDTIKIKVKNNKIMSKILVTGSAGFIGFHLCKKLFKMGKKVVGIDNINNYYDQKLKLSRLKILKKDKIFFYKNRH